MNFRITKSIIPETATTEDGTEYQRGRWITLTDKNDELKAESSSDDLLQFYEEGDKIYIQYYRTDYISVDRTVEFLQEFSVEDWKEFAEEDDEDEEEFSGTFSKE